MIQPILILAILPLLAQLRLQPAEELLPPERKRAEAVKKAEEPAKEIRPAILNLRPPSDPVSYVDVSAEPEGGVRTYTRPRVDAFSKNADGIGLQGYDLISYWDRMPAKGTREFSHEQAGVTWHFATKEHRDKFAQDPESYLPRFGGFCAYTVGKAYTATADPKVFAIDGGKLYLFYDPVARNVWEQDRAAMIARGDRNWPKLHRAPGPPQLP